MKKTGTLGYWHRASSNWKFITKDYEFDPEDITKHLEPRIPRAGDVAFVFLTNSMLSTREIDRLYHLTRDMFFPLRLTIWHAIIWCFCLIALVIISRLSF